MSAALLTQAIDEVQHGAIHYAGPLSHREVAPFLSICDLFLFPSRNEAEPLVVIEAIDCGLLVIALDVGCLAERLPTSTDVTSFRDSVERLLREFHSAADKSGVRQKWQATAREQRASFSPTDFGVITRGLARRPISHLQISDKDSPLSIT
jgi:glycosyltransferase involved in cell wall biosynthesis